MGTDEGSSWIRWLVAALVVTGLAVASCSGEEPPDHVAVESPTEAGENRAGASSDSTGDAMEVVEFTWATSYVADDYGVEVEVHGVLGDGWATYTMQATPVLGADGGDYADLIPMMVGAGVNGFVGDPPGPGAIDEIDPNGETEIRVDGDTRWYRLAWLLDEAPELLGGLEWVQLDGSAPPPAIDLASYVVRERFDDALRDLRAAADEHGSVTPPVLPEEDEILEVFGPWLGAEGPIEPTGSADDGAANWGVTYTYEPDGVDGFARGEVSWHTTSSRRPPVPDSSIDANELAALMG